MKKNKNKKKKFGECNSLVVRPRMSPEVAHFLFHNRNSAEINALSRYITNRFEDALSNTNARFDELSAQIGTAMMKFDALISATAKTFNLTESANMKKPEKEILVGGCYWLSVDMFEREVVVPVVIREVFGDEVEFTPLVADADMWETTAKKADLHVTKQEALAAIMKAKETPSS